MNVQFCCGGNQLEGFNNHDSEVDITKPLPYQNESVDFVLCEHGSEHISGPQVLHFFQEVHRILKPNGVFRVCIPVLDRLDRSESQAMIRLHGHLTIWNTRLIPTVLWAAGFAPGAIIGPCPINLNIDGHWKVIGQEQDIKETARFEATK